MRTCLRHSRCLFMKVGRIEAHRSGERLAMGETTAFPHQRVAVAGGHLDMIAKHGVMADLERSDARLRPIFRLQRGNGAPPIPRHSPEIVERSEEHTSELQSLMRISYAVFCLKKKNLHVTNNQPNRNSQRIPYRYHA